MGTVNANDQRPRASVRIDVDDGAGKRVFNGTTPGYESDGPGFVACELTAGRDYVMHATLGERRTSRAFRVAADGGSVTLRVDVEVR